MIGKLVSSLFLFYIVGEFSCLCCFSILAKLAQCVLFVLLSLRGLYISLSVQLQMNVAELCSHVREFGVLSLHYKNNYKWASLCDGDGVCGSLQLGFLVKNLKWIELTVFMYPNLIHSFSSLS